MGDHPRHPVPDYLTRGVGMRARVGLGVAALAVFIVEIALMRAVAQVTWPPFAFLALSAAMLGGGLAGTVLAVKSRWVHAAGTPTWGALIVAIGAPLAMWGALYVGLEPLRVGTDIDATVRFVVVLILLGLPFVGLALIVTALLESAPRSQSFGIYAADLLGAGAGAFLSVFAVNLFGTEGSALLAGALGASAGVLLGHGRVLRAASVGATVLLVVAIFAIPRGVPRATQDKRVGDLEATVALRKLEDNGRLKTFDRADARVDVVPARPAPALLIDLGAAVTRAPIFPTKKRPSDAAAAAFVASPPHDGVLVIGAGAGYEVARAIAWGADRVDAVEVSSAVVEAATSDILPSSKRVFAHERVHLHLDEARSFLERSERRWGHIVAVHTISNTAISAGAMRLAEDFLLTRESMHSLLGHVDDRGVLYLTRPAGQISLLADLARDALRSEGSADPDAHLVLLTPKSGDPFFSGLLVFKRPVVPDDDARTALTLPRGLRAGPPPPAEDRVLPTDARPFFHRLSDGVGDTERARLQIEGPDLAESAVAWVGGLATVVALLAVVVPLFFRRRQRRKSGLSAAHLGIAALLGIGFMVLELSLAQRLTLLSGRPTVAFAAVVGGMLLGAGAAGLAVQRLALKNRPSLAAALLFSAIACGVTLALPSVLGLAMGAGLFVRAVLVAGGAALIALPLGLGFPALIAEQKDAGSVPWLYAINATTSVGAAALHAAVAPWIGLDGTAIVAAVCYVAATLLARAR